MNQNFRKSQWKNPEEDISPPSRKERMEARYDGRLLHPFRCVTCGPSRSGKSTLIFQLLTPQDIIDAKFDYIILFLGTEAKANPLLCSMQEKEYFGDKMEIVEVKKKYSSVEEYVEKFEPDFERRIHGKEGSPGCVVFDDLMQELAKTDVLINLFTKYSSHLNISSVHITQNLFSKGGKRNSDHVTIYRNTSLLIIFRNPLDNTVLATVARRVADPATSKETLHMLQHIVNNHRYVAIFGGQNVPSELKFRSDLFATEPFKHQKVFQLLEKNNSSRKCSQSWKSSGV